MMKTKVISLFILLSIMGLFLSCDKKQKEQDGDKTLAVKVDTRQLSDESGFAMSNGEKCSITSEASIDFPVSTGDGAAVDSLQRLFAAHVLESGDTLTLDEAMRQVVVNSMHQYDFVREPATREEDGWSDDADLKYATSTRVTPIYNQNGVVTFERVDVVKKNDKVSSVTHRYYSFDVPTQTYIDVSSIFSDDAVADVCQLLRRQLMAQNNVTTNEQLNDLGYFNVENITVTRNFYFGKEGITWSYLPNELAVEAVGEPKVTIPYDDLKAFMCQGSVLERF